MLYDPETHELEGYTLQDGRYVRTTPDERGDLPIGSLGLALGLRPNEFRAWAGPWLRWIDPSGAPLPHGRERIAHARADRDAVERERDGLRRQVAELEALAKRNG